MGKNRMVRDMDKQVQCFDDNMAECESCVMNTICKTYEKSQKRTTGICPPSVKCLTEKGKENMEFKESPGQRIRANIASAVSQPSNMIPVIKMEYWDESKFIVRTDKAGYKKILSKLRVKMRSKFLALPVEDQTEIARKGNMVKTTEEMMSEDKYLKIKKE